MTIPCCIQDYLTRLESQIPEFASSRDLVRLGIFSSEPALCKARKAGNGPPYIRFSRGRIRYPRVGIIGFLLERLNSESNSSPMGGTNE